MKNTKKNIQNFYTRDIMARKACGTELNDKCILCDNVMCVCVSSYDIVISKKQHKKKLSCMKRKKCLKQNIKKMWAIWRSYVKKTTERNKKKEKLQLVFQRLRVTSFQGAVYNIYIWYYVYVWLYILCCVVCTMCDIIQ